MALRIQVLTWDNNDTLYSKSNTAYRYINTNYKQYMIHYTQYIIIAGHDINLGITNFFSHI
jgi:hypothetical protein